MDDEQAIARRARRFRKSRKAAVVSRRRDPEGCVGGRDSSDGSQVTDLSASVVVGLACAVLSAFGTNLAFLYKHRGAVAAPDVDMRHPLRSAADLFRSRWWTIGWLVAVAAFLAHVGALALLPLSTAQAVLSGGFVLLAVLAERFFGFQLGRRQWIGIILVAVSLALLGVTGKRVRRRHLRLLPYGADPLRGWRHRSGATSSSSRTASSG